MPSVLVDSKVDFKDKEGSNVFKISIQGSTIQTFVGATIMCLTLNKVHNKGSSRVEDNMQLGHKGNLCQGRMYPTTNKEGS